MLSIKVEGPGLRFKEERFYIVFPRDPDEMPQEFPTYFKAREYGDERFGKGNYEIESS